MIWVEERLEVEGLNEEIAERERDEGAREYCREVVDDDKEAGKWCS